MITVSKEQLAGIPSLQVVDLQKENNPLPLVIFWHGFTGVKEHSLHHAYLLAEEGYRVILPDALHHGERDKGISNDQRNLFFWEIVIQSIHETASIVSIFKEKAHIYHDDISIAGVSMGAIISLGAMTQFDWIKTAGSFMGTPAYEDFVQRQVEQMKRSSDYFPFTEKELSEKVALINQYDLSKKPEAIIGRELFFWHGEKDDVVPIKGAKDFVDHQRENDNIKLIVDKHAGHHVSHQAILDFVSWMKKRQTIKIN
ncbi:dienelactone hydrolase family protein [Salipaludibacillus daqingensis]|uniref:dienelactone hydrolase family protein n=1 Tax=Salipaludibacillus daqingensis TaxID=3041001 RepID=UPI002473AD60|nr:dienelactone hydrolase family protein [Salipaludibacillus daqingensis]